MSPRIYFTVSATIFGVVAVAHAVRVVLHAPVHIGVAAIPMWVSWIGALGAGALSICGFLARRRS